MKQNQKTKGSDNPFGPTNPLVDKGARTKQKGQKALVMKITDLNTDVGTLAAIPLWACEALEPGSTMSDILDEAGLALGWKPDTRIILPNGHNGVPIEDLIDGIRERRFAKSIHGAEHSASE